MSSWHRARVHVNHAHIANLNRLTSATLRSRCRTPPPLKHSKVVENWTIGLTVIGSGLDLLTVSKFIEAWTFWLAKTQTCICVRKITFRKFQNTGRFFLQISPLSNQGYPPSRRLSVIDGIHRNMSGPVLHSHGGKEAWQTDVKLAALLAPLHTVNCGQLCDWFCLDYGFLSPKMAVSIWHVWHLTHEWWGSVFGGCEKHGLSGIVQQGVNKLTGEWQNRLDATRKHNWWRKCF